MGVIFFKREDIGNMLPICISNALKGSQFYFYLLLLQLVLCRVAAINGLPVHHP